MKMDLSLLALAKREIPHLAVIPLTEAQTVWLSEAWRYLVETGNLPSYLQIRKSTMDRTGRDFDPFQIDRRLIDQKAIEITLLGILHIEQVRNILDDIDKLAYAIQQIVIKDYEPKDFNIHVIADELGIERHYARSLFMMVTHYGRFWQRASSQADGKPYGYEIFGMDVDNFDFYLRYKGIRSCLEDYFIRQGVSEPFRKRSRPFFRRPSQFTTTGTFPTISTSFINESRIAALENLSNDRFDISKLIRLCDELNVCYGNDCHYAMLALVRTLIDHVPPIFGKTTFAQVTTDCGSRNFKRAMAHLDNTSRTIANEAMHSPISEKEILVNEQTVNFSQDIDYLLTEIVHTLSINSTEKAPN
ncbi:MAG: hypothetical protein JNN04_11985 [Cyclobacteriaceae bacterium]|nr:hypothetical protein [Cyclobacteriaceae bacterium]